MPRKIPRKRNEEALNAEIDAITRKLTGIGSQKYTPSDKKRTYLVKRAQKADSAKIAQNLQENFAPTFIEEALEFIPNLEVQINSKADELIKAYAVEDVDNGEIGSQRLNVLNEARCKVRCGVLYLIKPKEIIMENLIKCVLNNDADAFLRLFEENLNQIGTSSYFERFTTNSQMKLSILTIAMLFGRAEFVVTIIKIYANCLERNYQGCFFRFIQNFLRSVRYIYTMEGDIFGNSENSPIRVLLDNVPPSSLNEIVNEAKYWLSFPYILTKEAILNRAVYYKRDDILRSKFINQLKFLPITYFQTLVDAVHTDDVNWLKYVIRLFGIDVNTVQQNISLPLPIHYAIARGNMEMVNELLKYGNRHEDQFGDGILSWASNISDEDFEHLFKSMPIESKLHKLRFLREEIVARKEKNVILILKSLLQDSSLNEIEKECKESHLYLPLSIAVLDADLPIAFAIADLYMRLYNDKNSSFIELDVSTCKQFLTLQRNYSYVGRRVLYKMLDVLETISKNKSAKNDESFVDILCIEIMNDLSFEK